MSVLSSTKQLRSQLWNLRIRAEETYGVAASDIHANGEFMGLIASFSPPDAKRQLHTQHGVRPNDFMPNGASPDSFWARQAWTAAYPRSFELSGSINDVILTNSNIFPFALGHTNDSNKGTYEEHIITERIELPSFTLEGTYYQASGGQQESLWVRYTGCKIDSMTITGNMGEPLRYSAKIIAQNVIHNVSTVAATDSQRQWLGFSSDLQSIQGDQPLDIDMSQDIYNFSGGEIAIFEPDAHNQPVGGSGNASYSRIENFQLTIDNSLSPEYYINNLDQFGTPTLSELVEGDRKYGLTINVLADDQDYFRLLMAQGYFGAERRGVGIKIRYDRPMRSNFGDTDYMEFRMPAGTRNIAFRDWQTFTPFNYDSATAVVGPIAGHESSNPVSGCFIVSGPHNRDISNPLIRVPLEIAVPSLEIYVRDRIAPVAIARVAGPPPVVVPGDEPPAGPPVIVFHGHQDHGESINNGAFDYVRGGDPVNTVTQWSIDQDDNAYGTLIPTVPFGQYLDLVIPAAQDGWYDIVFALQFSTQAPPNASSCTIDIQINGATVSSTLVANPLPIHMPGVTITTAQNLHVGDVIGVILTGHDTVDGDDTWDSDSGANNYIELWKY